MLKIHKAYRALATLTIDTVDEINRRIGKGKPLSEAVTEFGQLIALLGAAGGKELDRRSEGNDKSDSAQGSSSDPEG